MIKSRLGRSTSADEATSRHGIGHAPNCFLNHEVLLLLDAVLCLLSRQVEVDG